MSAVENDGTDGKKRLTDVANTAQLLRIIQFIPSPKAEPFKLWLAQGELAKRAGMSEKAVQNYELGSRMPRNMKAAGKFAAALG